MSEGEKQRISRRGLADRIGCAPSHIINLCQDGVIKVYHDDANGPISPTSEKFKAGYLILDEALKAYEDHKHPGKEHVRERHTEKRGHELETDLSDGSQHSQSVSRKDETGDGETSPDDSSSDSNVVTFADAKAKKAAVEAELQELNLLKKKGEVCDVASVEMEVADLAAYIRKTLEVLPDRLSESLAANSDPLSVHKVLTKEIQQILNDFADHTVDFGDKVRS